MRWVGWGKVWVKLVPCLKLVRIMLEIWNLVSNSTHISSFRKWVFSTRILLILLMSAFLGKNRSFTQRISRSCSSVSSFCKIKGYESKSFTDHPSRIRLLDCPKLLEMTSKMTMTSRFVDVTSWSVFWFLKLLCRVSLVKFS